MCTFLSSGDVHYLPFYTENKIVPEAERYRVENAQPGMKHFRFHSCLSYLAV
jgi:hypothetical protein